MKSFKGFAGYARNCEEKNTRACDNQREFDVQHGERRKSKRKAGKHAAKLCRYCHNGIADDGYVVDYAVEQLARVVGGDFGVVFPYYTVDECRLKGYLKL